MALISEGSLHETMINGSHALSNDLTLPISSLKSNMGDFKLVQLLT